MKYLVISGNPKTDGLCASITDEIVRGAKDGGADCEVIVPKDIDRCHVCSTGWGNCRTTRQCIFGGDGFDELRAKIDGADALCFVTPVYWGEVTEILKGFIDRLRRCLAVLGGNGAGLSEKPTLLVVSAGGSGNGTVTALEQLERFCLHTSAPVFDRFVFNRWNADYKKPAVYAAARAMAQGRKIGDTVM